LIIYGVDKNYDFAWETGQFQTMLTTCQCQRCSENISFDTDELNDFNRIVSCPHCKMETMLFVPVKPPLIPKPVTIYSTAPVQASKEYQGFYRSSDQKTIGGVCAGLAHKMKLNTSGIQVGFVLLGIFFLIGVIMYVAFWLAFKPLPTKNVLPFA
jgi:phage shock protein PspC (stress-responsive transcriptional regulator)